MPTKGEILEFIESSSSFVGKREIARAFQVKGADRVELKRLLKEMGDEGLIKGRRKRLTKKGSLPSVTVLDIVERDREGEFIAVPDRWDEDDGPRPRVLIEPEKRQRDAAAGLGDRVLARLTPAGNSELADVAYTARIIKKLPGAALRLLGIFRRIEGSGGVIDPIDRKQMREWVVLPEDVNNAQDGDLVSFDVEKGRRYGPSHARISHIHGNPDSEGAISLIAMHAYGIPDEFPAEVLQEAEQLEPPSPSGFEDLRDIPFVTIDPPDARDHDDAVWASPDEDKKNAGGWIVRVAIADVAYFVRPGSALDEEALKRGNSVYFPDRVVPMLPERISNNLCSLRADEDKACLCVRMVFDASGQKVSHSFSRGLMRSVAKLHYAQAQAAIDGQTDDITGPLLNDVIKPLWEAYETLVKARDARGPLNLDLPERKIILNDRGQVEAVTVPPRLEAHRLIEEFMIQANVCAAETLEGARSPLIYRIHDAPSQEKLDALRDFLATIDIPLHKSGAMRPKQFNGILKMAEDAGLNELVSEVVLRSQAQAEYSPDNIGHFGLNLRRYAHFTSPIRRYADLVVHRALIRALKLGPGGLKDSEIEALDETAQSISDAERRAIAAERQTVDRLIAAFLADRIGATFTANVSGIVRSGLFVRLHETGADGFVPASSLRDDYYRYQERQQALVGDRTGSTYRLGDSVEVRLVEAVPSAGALRFEMLSKGAYSAGTHKKGKTKPVKKRKGRNRASRRRQRA